MQKRGPVKVVSTAVWTLGAKDEWDEVVVEVVEVVAEVLLVGNVRMSMDASFWLKWWFLLAFWAHNWLDSQRPIVRFSLSSIDWSMCVCFKMADFSPFEYLSISALCLFRRWVTSWSLVRFFVRFGQIIQLNGCSLLCVRSCSRRSLVFSAR